MIVPKYFEDFDHLHVNTMPNRAYYIPASRRMEDLVENREASDRFFLLSGDWKFRYFTSVYDVKEEFFAEGYDTSVFETIPVPSVWQNYGHDHHQYTNVRYPFPVDPPYVPYENPCGAYVRTFEWKKQEEAPRAFLKFEGVDSCLYVWMNGMSSAVGIITGKTVGAGQYEKMKEYSKTVQMIFLFVGLISGAAVFLARDGFISLYNASPEAQAYSRQFINVISVTIIGTCYQAACLFGLVKSGWDISFVF